MHTKSGKLGRLALVGVAMLAVMALFAPATALAKAKTTTRIVVASQVVVDHGTSGETPTGPIITAKLQKRIGSRWVSFKGTVKRYFWNVRTGKWDYDATWSGFSVRVEMGIRGKYKLVYAGTSKMKSAYAYTKRLDTIGESISPVAVAFRELDATWTGVDVSYRLDWNSSALQPSSPNPIVLAFDGTFRNAAEHLYSGYVGFQQEIWEPGTYEFSYRVRTADLVGLTTFDSSARILSEDPYVRTSAVRDEPTPLLH